MTAHAMLHLPARAASDQYIGGPDMLDRRPGSMFIRACEKAGFVIVSEPLDTRWGHDVLMECRR